MQEGVEIKQTEQLDCELCILGAGIAGLNALFAASRHLASTDKVVLVDRNDGPAGMWHRVYDYVRLHQPHPAFTAGNIKWRNQADPHHLATKAEVNDHLQYCYEVLHDRISLDPYFGHEYVDHQENATSAHPVTVRCRRLRDGAEINIRTRKLIKAFGYDVKPKPPLSVSSNQVLSISPESHDLLGPELRDATAPIYVVGGGKTGMDTAHILIRHWPRKRVRFLVGAGTLFMNRDRLSPRGLRRHVLGTTPIEAFLDAARRFDGRNEVEVMDHFRRRHTVSLDASCRRFMFGVLSQRENREISRGVDEVIKDHLSDVVDGPNGPLMVLRSGVRRPIEPGAVLINTTGYLVRDDVPYEPYLSPSGNVISIQGTSAIHFLSSQTAYFLAHLFLLGKLRSTPLYEVNWLSLFQASRDAFGPTAITLTLYNTWTVLEQMPRWVMDENGLDFMRLVPLHRRLLAVGKLVSFMKRHPRQFSDALDVVRERFGVRLGPLAQPPP